MGSNLESRGWVYAYSYLKQLWPESYSCCPVSGRGTRQSEHSQRRPSLRAAFSLSSNSSLVLLRGRPSFIPASSTPSSEATWGGFSGRGQGADAYKWVRQEGWGAVINLKTPLPRLLQEYFCLMAHGGGQSNCPLAPWGAAAKPTWCPARPSLTMWQAWMDAHDRAWLPAPPAKEPDAAIGKNCFTIWNLGPLIIARRGWRGEVQSGGLKMPASPCIHQCLLYCLLSGTILLMFLFFCNQVILPSLSRPSWGKGETGGKGSVCSLLLCWPTTPACTPAFRLICFLFYSCGPFLSESSDKRVVLSRMLRPSILRLQPQHSLPVLQASETSFPGACGFAELTPWSSPCYCMDPI